jgi:hypothetical protein
VSEIRTRKHVPHASALSVFIAVLITAVLAVGVRRNDTIRALAWIVIWRVDWSSYAHQPYRGRVWT